ncbi:MAG TPA: hypothetical protein VHP33_04875 [Polyangiaceae bacterium]|nr:hypothetical protein [Polyangiaceae bacterium]
MGSRLLLGAPLVLLSAGCTISMRAGPEVRTQPTGAVLEGRGTFTMGLGSASGEQGTQLGIPLSLSGGSRLDGGDDEGTFESGLEYASVGERFGFRAGGRIGTQMGEATGGYAGLRGGPVLMLKPPREGHAAPAITLEGLAAVGTGGDVEGGGLFGLCLSVDLDFYSKFNLGLPHGRPLRCDDGSTWRGRARLGRRRSASLGRQLASAERERIGLSYLEDGLDEHASVPAFERLALELAEHGAPRSLIARARAAAAEEIRHARTCFALAAAYLGRDVRASELPYLCVRRARPLLEIARESWWDGCVGEGAAAQVVVARAADTRDPSERRALRGIARDERGHARLAADVVTWAAQRDASA